MRNSKVLKGAMALLMSAALVGNCSLFEEEEDDDSLLLLAALALQCRGVSGDITENTTWSESQTICGPTYVKDGATLTVEAGTTVKSVKGAVLFIEAGAKIEAVGTASSPIVFTSSRGEGGRSAGDWSGIVIVGNAPVAETGTTEGPIGINYGGGSDSTESSGTLKYVRIEFAGAQDQDGNELNALSLYAVGSGTTIEYVQAHMGVDDGFEWFGGTVNASYLLTTGIADDSYDMDSGAVVTAQYLTDYKYPSDVITYKDGARGFELDHSGTSPKTNLTIRNFVGFGNTGADDGINTDDDATADLTVTLQDGILVNYPGSDEIDDNNSHVSCTSNVLTEDGSDCSTGTTTVAGTVSTQWSSSDPTTEPVFTSAARTVMNGSDTTPYWSGWSNWRNN